MEIGPLKFLKIECSTGRTKYLNSFTEFATSKILDSPP